jgi:hypothetical protein
VHTGFWWGNLKECGNFKDLGIDGRIIINWIFKKWDGGMDYINLAQDRAKCWALLNVVMKLMNLHVP